MKVPRWIGSHCLGKENKRQFHLFSDASVLGIAATCYARFVDDVHVTHVSLVAAKAHVIPSNEKTSCLHGSIPRAELDGAWQSLSKLRGGIFGAAASMQLELRP